jgi:hypothetical protein
LHLLAAKQTGFATINLQQKLLKRLVVVENSAEIRVSKIHLVPKEWLLHGHSFYYPG